MLIQVPAGPDLYGPLDEGVGHSRRFTEEELEDVLRAAGLELVKLEQFNRLGAIGWRIHHSTGSGRITAGEAVLFDLLVPLAKVLEPLLPGPGLSLLAVARVP